VEQASEKPAPLSPPSPPERVVIITVAAFGAAEFGTVPEPGVGAGIAPGFAYRRARAEIALMAEPSHAVALTDTPGVGARFSLLRAMAHGCFAVLDQPIEIAPCLGAGATWMRARGYGVANPADNTTKWAEVAAGGIVRVNLVSGLGARLDGFAVIPVRRQEVTLSPNGTIHTVPAVTMLASLGLDYRF
jgi:hypothetical protein